MNGNGTLACLSTARAALDKARTMADVLDIRDKAEAVRVYAKAAGESLAAQNHAAEIKLRAERRAGELLREMEKQNGGHAAKARLRDATEVIPPAPPSLEELGIEKTQSHRWQKEATVTEEAFEDLVCKCRDEMVELTQASLLKVAGAGHVSQACGENEWYTPPEIIERARAAMGGIDLDPASCEVAQAHVKAKRFFSIADDGLEKKWSGRVWMNPPYSKDLCSRFAAKLLKHVAAKHVTEACVLVNNATETAWLQSLFAECGGVCFPSGRIQFLNAQGKRANSPLQGQAVIYFGSHNDAFHREFQECGCVFFR